jgi:predicted nucleic acid-binding protein
VRARSAPHTVPQRVRRGLLVLDSGALSALAEAKPRARAVLDRADDEQYLVVVPVSALAEAIRTGSHPRDAPVNRILNQRSLAQRVEIDERIARLAAELRYRASGGRSGRVLLLDAFVAACAVATREPAVVLTSDPDGLSRLLDGYSTVVVEST